MNPVLHFKMWGHVHQPTPFHGGGRRFSHWAHGEDFWPTVGVVVFVTLIGLMIFLSIKYVPFPLDTMPYSTYPQYFGIP